MRRSMAIGCLAGITLAAPTATLWAQPDPVVVVTLEDHLALMSDGTGLARGLVQEIYGRAGVTIRWTPDATDIVDRSLTLSLVNAERDSRRADTQAMGVAPSPGDGTRGTQAYVFVDRVRAFAQKHHVSEGYVLACAIAHEIGHLLLPPTAHTAEGIMQAAWHAKQFPPLAAGLPGFPAAQARLLRLRARRAATPTPF